MIDFCFRRVDVLGLVLILSHHPRAECYYLPGKVMHRENHPSAKAIIRSPFVVLYNKPCFLKKLFIIILLYSFIAQVVPAFKRIAQFKFLNRSIIKTALTEISQSNGLAFL